LKRKNVVSSVFLEKLIEKMNKKLFFQKTSFDFWSAIHRLPLFSVFHFFSFENFLFSLSPRPFPVKKLIFITPIPHNRHFFSFFVITISVFRQ